MVRGINLTKKKKPVGKFTPKPMQKANNAIKPANRERQGILNHTDAIRPNAEFYNSVEWKQQIVL